MVTASVKCACLSVDAIGWKQGEPPLRQRLSGVLQDFVPWHLLLLFLNLPAASTVLSSARQATAVLELKQDADQLLPGCRGSRWCRSCCSACASAAAGHRNSTSRLRSVHLLQGDKVAQIVLFSVDHDVWARGAACLLLLQVCRFWELKTLLSH